MSALAFAVSDSLSPLTPVYKRCVTALLVFGLLSLVTGGLLFLHITSRLIIWKIRDSRSQRKMQAKKPPADTITSQSIDLSLGLSESHYFQTRQRAAPECTAPPPPRGALARADTIQSMSTGRPKPPNPLLLLIFNLLLSDLFLSAAYMSNAIWLAGDGIMVETTTCKVQAWSVSFGSLVTSGFLFTISLFSYFGIIRGYKPSTWVVVGACSAVWIFSLFLASVGLIFVDIDDLYRRQTLWCWVGEPHRNWRWAVYAWGFTTMSGTSFIYTVIFCRLWREGRSSRFMPRRPGSIISNRAAADDSTPLRPSGHHPAFLVYPSIYMITGTPMILGSLIPVLENSPIFMGIAGCLLASTGFLDSVLWSSIILFSNREDIRNAGLDQFSFMRTPEGRTLGNIVYVQGGGGGGGGGAGGDNLNNNWQRASWHSKKKKQQGWGRLGDHRNSSHTSLPDQMAGGEQGIKMDIVTTVVVEGQPSSSPPAWDQASDGDHEPVKHVESHQI